MSAFVSHLAFDHLSEGDYDCGEYLLCRYMVSSTFSSALHG